MKFRYTITTIMEHNPEEFECKPEDLLENLRLYVKDDPEYVIEGLDKFTIAIEEVKE